MIKLRAEYRDVKIGSGIERWTVLGHQFTLPKKPKGHSWFCVCECDCGKIRLVDVCSLQQRLSRSCGCLQAEKAAVTCRSRTRHGQTNTKLFSVWSGIKKRCADKSNMVYGGRGIGMCDVWMNSFEEFREYSISHGYDEGLQIDRYPDVDGNYEPGNVRFVTSKTNNRNRRNTRFITAFGVTKSIEDWVDDERCVVSSETLTQRLLGKGIKHHWSAESAITTHPLKNGHDRRCPPLHIIGTPSDIKTIYEARGLTKNNGS